MATINVLPEYDMQKIAEEAGQTDQTKIYCVGGSPMMLYVEDIEQTALDAALVTYLTQHDALYLERMKNVAKADIDKKAEDVRLKYITGGAGQALVYSEKAEEAADYIAAGEPASLAQYPFIQAEVNATGKTASQAANDILNQKTAWIAVGAQIEQIRIGSKTTIDLATSVLEVEMEKTTALSELSSL